MIVLTPSSHERSALGSGLLVRDPRPREQAGRDLAVPEAAVQGVIVQPPRESKVSVRVEIVTEQDGGSSGGAEQPRPPLPASVEPRRTDWAPPLSASTLPPPMAARLGVPDLRHAADAYRTHAELQAYVGAPDPGLRRLSIRA